MFYTQATKADATRGKLPGAVFQFNRAFFDSSRKALPGSSAGGLLDLVYQIVSSLIDPGYLRWAEVLSVIPGLLDALQSRRYLLD